MRKLFFFLSLLLTVGTAGAQGITDLSSISNSKIYTIKNNRGGYLKVDENKLEVSSATDETNSQFALIKLPENNLYYLYSVSLNKFVTKLNDSRDGVYTEAPSFRHAFALVANGILLYRINIPGISNCAALATGLTMTIVVASLLMDYSAPQATLINLSTEGMMAMSAHTDESITDKNHILSNKREGWNSDMWSNMNED